MSAIRRPMLFRVKITLFVLLAAGLLAACTGKVVIVPVPENHKVFGTVNIAGTNIPVYEAELRFSGPVFRTVKTDRTGQYSVHLPAGRYTVEVRTVHGTYLRSVHVSGTTHFNLQLDPAWFNAELLYQISGMRRIFWNPNTNAVEWDYGELHRWEQSQVRVYFDFANSVGGAQRSWADSYWSEIYAWQQLLGGKVMLLEVFDPSLADIVIQWKLLQNGAASRQLQYYENGALRKVLIEIDVRFWDDSALWVHQMAHAMGLSYLNDPQSVLYPLHLPQTQRVSLSPQERNHARLVYDLPSGLRLLSGFSILSLDETEGEEQPPATFEVSRSSGYRGYLVTGDGEVFEIDEWEVRRMMNE